MRGAALLVAFIATDSAHSEPFEYVQPFHDRHVISIQPASGLVASGDRASNATFCSRDEGYVCVRSEWLNFAAPISKASSSEWKFENNTYTVKGRRRLLMLGTSMNVLDIESTQSTRTFRFLYSKEKGLVAFSVEVDGKPATFVLQGITGFGHQ
jgi:hypothetical protein